jgi:hypothetical protein
VVLAISLAFLWKIRFSFARLHSYLAHRTWALRSALAFSFFLKWMTPVLLAASLLPVVFLLVWGIATSAALSPPVVGFILVFLGLAMLSACFGFARWHFNKWTLTDAVRRCFAASVVCFLAFQISTVFLEPYSFFGKQSIVPSRRFGSRYLCLFVQASRSAC